MKNYLILLLLPNVALSHTGSTIFHFHIEGLLVLLFALAVIAKLIWRKKIK
jgi:hypothetical protein